MAESSEIAKEAEQIAQLITAKNWEEAFKRLEIALKEHPTDVNYLLDYGFVAGNLKRHDDAITAYNKVIELLPKSSSGYTGLGFIYSRWGKPKQAVEQFKKAVEFAPDNVMIHYELGQNLLEQDEYADALKSFLKAIQFGGAETEAETLHAISQCKLGLDDPDGAISAAENVLKRDAGFWSAYSLLGTAYFMKEDWKSAVEAFEKYLERVPEDEGATALLAKAKEQL